MLLRSPVSRKVGRSVETDLFVAKLFSRCEPTKRGSAKLEEKQPHFWTSPIFYDHFNTLSVLECVHLLIRRIAIFQISEMNTPQKEGPPNWKRNSRTFEQVLFFLIIAINFLSLSVLIFR